MTFLATSHITINFVYVLDIVTVYSFLATHAIGDALKIKNGPVTGHVVCIRIQYLLIPFLSHEIKDWVGLIYGFVWFICSSTQLHI
jgi:hypothetical protein